MNSTHFWRLLVAVLLGLPAASPTIQGQILPSVGDEVIVQVDGAPLRAKGRITGKAQRGTRAKVLQTHGPWLGIEVPGRGRKAWVHANHVTSDGAPQGFGKPPVPLANLMWKSAVDPMNMIMMTNLTSVARGILASGRGMELIRIKEDMWRMLGRARNNPVGVLWRIQFCGIVSDAYRTVGNRDKAVVYVREMYRLASEAKTKIDRGQLPGNSPGFWKLTILELMGKAGWAESLYGRLVEGERKLAAVTRELDAWLPSTDLDRTYMAIGRPLDGNIHTSRAEVLIKLGRVNDAIPLLMRALRMNQAHRDYCISMGIDASGTTGWTEALYATCLACNGQERKAFELMEQSQRHNHRHAIWTGHVNNPYWEIIAREEHEEYMEEAFHRAISIAAQKDKGNPNAVDTMSSAWILNRKLKAEETLRKRMSSMRVSSPNPKPFMFPLITIGTNLDGIATNERILSTRGLAANLRLRQFSAVDRDDARQEFETLRHVANMLVASRVNDVSPPSGIGISASGESVAAKPIEWHDKLAKRTWVDVHRLQEKLTPGQVFVDFIRYRDFDFQALKNGKYRWRSDRYAAWLIPSKGKVKRLDLGPAGPIEQAIRQMRKAIQLNGEARASFDEAKFLIELNKDSEALATLVLEPLRAHFENTEELILCPDGELWLVPWNSLPWKKDQFLLERFQLRMVMTGRSLVQEESYDELTGESPNDKNEVNAGPPLVLGDPDFNMSTDRVMEVESVLFGRELKPLVTVAKRGETLLHPVGRLPSTSTEARDIAAPLKAYCGTEPQVYVGQQALERHLLETQNPRVLVLGTHGFFLPAGHQQLGEKTLPIGDPTMRCGLLLAGCNRADEWLIGRGFDGILTGYEVAALDLRGTELVVLSACDTGIGDVRQGEGVAGLRQAFQMAGAQSVVASLWQIPDRDTALIMIDFFKNLAAGQSKAAALRNAQLSRIKARRKRYLAAHPFFWAAFSLSE